MVSRCRYTRSSPRTVWKSMAGISARIRFPSSPSSSRTARTRRSLSAARRPETFRDGPVLLSRAAAAFGIPGPAPASRNPHDEPDRALGAREAGVQPPLVADTDPGPGIAAAEREARRAVAFPKSLCIRNPGMCRTFKRLFEKLPRNFRLTVLTQPARGCRGESEIRNSALNVSPLACCACASVREFNSALGTSALSWRPVACRKALAYAAAGRVAKPRHHHRVDR